MIPFIWLSPFSFRFALPGHIGGSGPLEQPFEILGFCDSAGGKFLLSGKPLLHEVIKEWYIHPQYGCGCD